MRVGNDASGASPDSGQEMVLTESTDQELEGNVVDDAELQLSDAAHENGRPLPDELSTLDVGVDGQMQPASDLYSLDDLLEDFSEPPPEALAAVNDAALAF